jgi:hypothetical protein
LWHVGDTRLNLVVGHIMTASIKSSEFKFQSPITTMPVTLPSIEAWATQSDNTAVNTFFLNAATTSARPLIDRTPWPLTVGLLPTTYTSPVAMWRNVA